MLIKWINTLIMKYNLIWKSIDAEISKEENSILEDFLAESPIYIAEYNKAKQLDEILTTHYSHTMDDSFLLKLKKLVIEELDIPYININYFPIILFAAISVIITVVFGYLPAHRQIDLNIELSVYLPYITMITSVCFAGLLLFGLDSVLKSRFKRV